MSQDPSFVAVLYLLDVAMSLATEFTFQFHFYRPMVQADANVLASLCVHEFAKMTLVDQQIIE